AGLLLAGAAFLTYDQMAYRAARMRTVSTVAQVLASNSVTSLVFNDPESANAMLSALHNSINLRGATLFRTDGSIFAHYSRAEQATLPKAHSLQPDEVERYWVEGQDMVLARAIDFEG